MFHPLRAFRKVIIINIAFSRLKFWVKLPSLSDSQAPIILTICLGTVQCSLMHALALTASIPRARIRIDFPAPSATIRTKKSIEMPSLSSLAFLKIDYLMANGKG